MHFVACLHVVLHASASNPVRPRSAEQMQSEVERHIRGPIECELEFEVNYRPIFQDGHVPLEGIIEVLDRPLVQASRRAALTKT